MRKYCPRVCATSKQVLILPTPACIQTDTQTYAQPYRHTQRNTNIQTDIQYTVHAQEWGNLQCHIWSLFTTMNTSDFDVRRVPGP